MLMKSCVSCDAMGMLRVEGNVFETCAECHGDGVVPDGSEDRLVYVNAYEVTREYGGAEEGGWWFNAFRCLESVQVKNIESNLVMEQVESKYDHLNEGNIYSVLGGSKVVVEIEATEKESETTEVPQYE